MLFFIVLILIYDLVLLIFLYPNRLLAWISLFISINSLLLEIVQELLLWFWVLLGVAICLAELVVLTFVVAYGYLMILHYLRALDLEFLLARVLVVAPAGNCILACNIVDRTAIFFILDHFEYCSSFVLSIVCILDWSLGFADWVYCILLHKAGIFVASSLLGYFIFTLTKRHQWADVRLGWSQRQLLWGMSFHF